MSRILNAKIAGGLIVASLICLTDVASVKAAGPVGQASSDLVAAEQLTAGATSIFRHRYYCASWGYSAVRPPLYVSYRYPAARYAWSTPRPYYYGGYVRPAYTAPYAYQSVYYGPRYGVGTTTIYGGVYPHSYAAYGYRGYSSYGYAPYVPYQPYAYRPYYTYPTAYWRYGYYRSPSMVGFAYPYGYPGGVYSYGVYGY